MKTQDIIDMSPRELEIRLLEQNLCVLWNFTQTQGGCKAFVDSLHDMEQEYKGRDQQLFNMVHDCRDLAWTKGNILALQDNAQQLLDAQQAFVGEI